MLKHKKTAFKRTLNAVLILFKKKFIEWLSQSFQFYRFHFLSDV